MFGGMFNPAVDQKAEKAKIRKECARIRDLALELIPEAQRAGLHLNVQEIMCGDPECAPIDTVIQLTWEAPGLSKPLGIPKISAEVTKEDVTELFADPNVNLAEWQAGNEFASLRFGINSRVSCRIGDDPVTGWAPGMVVKTQYRESNWPPGVFAPYQIRLDDGRLIFAPHDIPEVIRE